MSASCQLLFCACQRSCHTAITVYGLQLLPLLLVFVLPFDLVHMRGILESRWQWLCGVAATAVAATAVAATAVAATAIAALSQCSETNEAA